MLSASKAKEMTQNNIKELKNIEEGIEHAIDNGEFVIMGSGDLKPMTLNKLRELGYDVIITGTEDHHTWRISWY